MWNEIKLKGVFIYYAQILCIFYFDLKMLYKLLLKDSKLVKKQLKK